MCGPRSFCSQFSLLLWKNWTLKKRRPCATLLEILIPLFAMLILILIRSLIHIDDVGQSLQLEESRSILLDESQFASSMACGNFYQPSFAHDRYSNEIVAMVIPPQIILPVGVRSDVLFPCNGDESIIISENGGTPSPPSTSLPPSLLPSYNFTCSLTHSIQSELYSMYMLFSGSNEMTDCASYTLSSGDFGTKPPVNMTSYLLAPFNTPMGAWRIYNDEGGIYDYIEQNDYGIDIGIQTFAFEVQFDVMDFDTLSFSYSLRMNSSDVPWTGTSVDNLQVGFDYDTWGLYYINHITTLQLMIDRYIVRTTMKIRDMVQMMNVNAEERVNINGKFHPLVDENNNNQNDKGNSGKTSWSTAPFTSTNKMNFHMDSTSSPALWSSSFPTPSPSPIPYSLSTPSLLPNSPLLSFPYLSSSLSSNFSPPSPPNSSSTSKPSYLTDVWFIPFPTAAHKQDNFKSDVSSIFGVFLVIAFMWPFSRLVRAMVEEKEKKIKEGMKMMGLQNSVFWMSWSTTYFVLFFILCLSIVLATKSSLFPYSNFGIVFFFFFFFSLSLISLACALTTFFDRAKTAGTISPFFLLLFYLPYFAVSDPTSSANLQNFLSLLSPVAFTLGSINLLSWEGAFIGVQSSNLSQIVGNYSMANCLIFLIFDTIIYALIAWYVDQCYPSEYGTHKPVYFIFLPSYWKACFTCGNKKKSVGVEDDDDEPTAAKMVVKPRSRIGSRQIPPQGDLKQSLINSPPSSSSSDSTAFIHSPPLYESDDEVEFGDEYEPVPDNMKPKLSIKLRGLTKAYPNRGTESNVKEVLAVKGVDLNLYEGQLFFLLGHNGAGKTTTINMLTGMVPVTRGKATIYGKDVATEMDDIRSFIGVCPQHDVLFDDLNVSEHLAFFAKLKGAPTAAIPAMVRSAIKEVQLQTKTYSKSSSLSGGQKRRLSLAIALIGDSKVLFIDECSSGVDPASRLALHSVLLRAVRGESGMGGNTARTMVVTTHFMDEADSLGDRVGIMHHGKMKSCGSPLFLKNRFGAGYHMTIMKNHKASSAQLLSFMKATLPQAEIMSDVGTELSYRIPLASSSIFPTLLQSLEENRKVFDIETYGLSVTTLEEVFMRVALESREEEEKEERDKLEGEGGNGQKSITNGNESNNGHHTQRPNDKSESLLPPSPSLSTEESTLSAHPSESYFSRHLSALLKKRYHVSKRDRKALLCQVVLPLILLVLGLGLLRIPPNFSFPDYQIDPTQEFNLPLYVPLSPQYNNIYNNSLYNYNEYNHNVIPEDFSDAVNATQFSLEILNGRLTSPNGLSRYAAYSYGLNWDDAFNMTQLANLTQTINNTIHSNPFYEELYDIFKIWYNSTYLLPSSEYQIWVNISATHGLPTFLNMGNNALLRQISKNTEANIKTSIHPFDFTRSQKQFFDSVNGVFAAIVIAFGFSFIPASFAVFIVSEREYKSKHIQIISGISILSYWLSNFIWDFVSYTIPAVISAIIVYAYANPNFVGENFPAVLAVFLMYGLSVIPFTYCLSFLFKSHSTAQNVMIMVYLVGGVILTLVDFALYTIPSTHDANDKYIRYLFRLIPNYCLGDAIFYLSTRSFLHLGPFDPFITGYDLLFMFFESIFYFLLTLFLEYAVNNPRFVAIFSRDPPMTETMVKEDEDVEMERVRLQKKYGGNENKENFMTESLSSVESHDSLNRSTSINGTSSPSSLSSSLSTSSSNLPTDDMIRIEGLQKNFPGKAAVKDLWFGVPLGQCFGFLGVNGAGKSTTLKILTGDELPTMGKAFIGGMNIADHPNEVRRLIGYCPQFDALHENLTANETLEFYGRIRGIPEAKLASAVQYLVDKLSLTEYAKRPAGTYSGGNKRKLSIAIALIGNPKVVFLDECTTGVDAISSRFIWSFISETMANRAVILTTHSMEECEALCQRIGILVSGQLRCVGSSQHLKNRFGQGFQIDISTGGNDPYLAQQFIQKMFPQSVQLEAYGSKLKYRIEQQGESKDGKEPKLSLRQIFSILESNKTQVGINEYSVGQTTLEQIFISFAKQGDEQRDLRGGLMNSQLSAPKQFVSPAIMIGTGISREAAEKKEGETSAPGSMTPNTKASTLPTSFTQF